MVVFEKLEAFLDWGGTKKDIVFVVLSGLAMIAALIGVPTPIDPSWLAIILCGVPIILGAIIGLVTEFDIKADVLVSIALLAAIATGEIFAAGEVAVIMHDGLRRMVTNQEDVFYYITLMNENYPHPALPAGSEEGILKGAYLLKDGGDAEVKVQLMGSGTILREVEAAADLLRNDFGIAADVWSVTSFNLLNRDGRETARWNLLHPTETPREAYLTRALAGRSGPFIAATDYIRAYADQVREFVPGRYTVLGTDGFGRSDSRQNLRKFFEVDRHYVVVAALKALADEGKLPAARVAEAMTRYGIDADKPASWLV